MAEGGKRIAVFGMSGSGKTELAHSLLKNRKRVLVVDPKGSFAKKDEYEELKHFSQIKPFLEDMGDGAFRAVYMPEALQGPKRLSTLGSMLLDLQSEYFWTDGEKGQEITLVVDELHDLFPLGLPGGLPGFAEVCTKGRESGINVIGISQSPSSVHQKFRANLNMVAAFEFSFINDRKAIARAMEDEAVVNELESLEEFHYVAFDRKNKTKSGKRWQVMKPISLS